MWMDLFLHVAIFLTIATPQQTQLTTLQNPNCIEDEMNCPIVPIVSQDYFESNCFCDIFYQCDYGIAQRKFCDLGLWFHWGINVCDSPENVNRTDCIPYPNRPFTILPSSTTTKQPILSTTTNQLETTNSPFLTTTTNSPLSSTTTNSPLPSTTTNSPLATTTNSHLPSTTTNSPLPTTTKSPLPTTTNQPLPSTTSNSPPTSTTTNLPLSTRTSKQPIPTTSALTSEPITLSPKCPKDIEDLIDYCRDDQNSFCCYPMSHQLSLVIGSTTGVISAIGVIGNVITIGSVTYTFFMNPTNSEMDSMTGSPMMTHIFLLQICLMDIIYCLTVLTTATYERISMRGLGDQTPCVLVAAYVNICRYGERIALVMLAFQKAVVVFRPKLGNPPCLHLKACVILIMVSWTISLMTMIPTLINSISSTSPFPDYMTFGTFGYNPTKGSCDIINETGSLFGVEILVPLCLMTMAYMSVWWSVTLNKPQYITNLNEDNRKEIQARDQAVELRIAIVILSACLSYVVCALPLTLANIFFPGDLTGFSLGILILLHDLQFSINFIVYALIPSPLREAQVKFINRLIYKTKLSFSSHQKSRELMLATPQTTAVC